MFSVPNRRGFLNSLVRLLLKTRYQQKTTLKINKLFRRVFSSVRDTMFLSFGTFLFASVWTRNLLIGAIQYTNSPSTNTEANIQKHPQHSLKVVLIYSSQRNVHRGSSLQQQAVIQRVIRMRKSSGYTRCWLELHCL